MDTITPLQREDIPDVSRLFTKVFRHRDEVGSPSMQAYLDLLYLKNPWSTPSLTSLISRDAHGHLMGFIGSIPRPMLVRRRRIMTVVAGNHMVDPTVKDPFVAVRLLRTLLGQGQELTFSDSANPASCRMWEGIGGRVELQYSLRWIRLLKPLSTLASTASGRLGAPLLGNLVWPLTALVDLPLDRMLLNRGIRREARSLRGGSLDPATLAQLSERFGAKQDLQPSYDEAGLEWLLSLARQKDQYGPLSARVVTDGSQVIGAHMVHCKWNQTAEVLSLLWKPGFARQVISHLFTSVLRLGGVAVMGRANPWDVSALSTCGSLFFQRSASTVVHSKNPDILNIIAHGNAWLSRLEGEWWTRLQGDRFEEA